MQQHVLNSQENTRRDLSDHTSIELFSICIKYSSVCPVWHCWDDIDEYSYLF